MRLSDRNRGAKIKKRRKKPDKSRMDRRLFNTVIMRDERTKQGYQPKPRSPFLIIKADKYIGYEKTRYIGRVIPWDEHQKRKVI